MLDHSSQNSQAENKKLKYAAENLTERMKYELEFQDNSIFENLSIFKDLREQQRMKKTNNTPVPAGGSQNSAAQGQEPGPRQAQATSIQHQNYYEYEESEGDAQHPPKPNEQSTNQFWKVGEEEGSICELTDQINFTKLQSNKILQNMKKKEIEKKLEKFFAYNSPDNESINNMLKQKFQDAKNQQQQKQDQQLLHQKNQQMLLEQPQT